ncbi:MAG: hypothetical protein AB1529_01350 [Candidatus Micrarchaeota archaeon]
MRGAHYPDFDKPPGRMKRLAAAVFSAYLLSSCAHAPDASLNRPVAAAEKIQPGGLQGQWERGECSFSGNSVSYRELPGGREATLRLDVQVRGAESVLCSDGFTVVVSPGSMAVAIGAEGVLDGQEMLGILGGRFVVANSYEINTGRLERSGALTRTGRIVGGRLVVPSASGGSWSIDLADPFRGWDRSSGRWSIY